MKATLILGPTRLVPQWQYEALLQAVESGLEIVTVLHCMDTPRRKYKMAHVAYYILALTSRLRMPSVQSRDISPLVSDRSKIFEFKSQWIGNWQKIPAEFHGELQNSDVAIKFGMNLLLDPEALPVRNGVISYHHGDPTRFRGRPAGFYELAANEPVMGVIIQQLTNTLDGGPVLSKAYAQVVRHSYAKTLNGAYQAGIPLLRQALSSLPAESEKDPTQLGPNYSLPTNRCVFRIMLKTTLAMLKRFIYGLLREKSWRIGFTTYPLREEQFPDLHIDDISQIAPPNAYSFIADPVGSSREMIYCEGMNARTGKGEILTLSENTWRPVAITLGGGHLSYPQIVQSAGDGGPGLLFPEMASIGAPTIFQLDSSGLACKSSWQMTGLEKERIVDGTLLKHDGNWYLFGGLLATCNQQLHLWFADDLRGPWRIHPKSPICNDPRRSRMAGPVLSSDGRLYRFGQDGSSGYGNGAAINRIEILNRLDYSETHLQTLRIEGACGPHSIQFVGEKLWLDLYTERWTPMAGIRRLLNRLAIRE